MRRRAGESRPGQALDLAQADVVDQDLGIVRLTPFLDEDLVEPSLECGNEIPPAQYAQRLAPCADRSGENRGRQSR
jgi:hypothetical protein